MEQSNDQAFRNAGSQRCRGIGNSRVDSAYRSIDIRDHWRTVKQPDEVAQLQSSRHVWAHSKNVARGGRRTVSRSSHQLNFLSAIADLYLGANKKFGALVNKEEIERELAHAANNYRQLASTLAMIKGTPLAQDPSFIDQIEHLKGAMIALQAQVRRLSVLDGAMHSPARKGKHALHLVKR
ncbi:hypothetical protein [Pseudomonas sp. LF090]